MTSTVITNSKSEMLQYEGCIY